MSIKPKAYKTRVTLPKRSIRKRNTESARNQSRTTRKRNGDRRAGVGLQISFNGKRGIDVLRDPELNKSTAFTETEKQALGIVGLVPDVTESEDLQLSRVLMQPGHKNTDLDRYVYLVNLLDHNET